MDKIYHVKTQADYDALMVELEAEGYKWLGGECPTQNNVWVYHEEETCVEVKEDETLQHGNKSYFEDSECDIHEYTAVDNVNSPNHYTAGGIETIDYIKAKMTSDQFAGYCTGNILKYISRYPFKNGVEDLEKAKVYLEWLISAEGERL